MIKQATSVKSVRAVTRLAKPLVELYLDRYAICEKLPWK